MGEPYAEVIGDPVGHSLSPLIHKYWLKQFGLPGDYRAVRCTPADLSSYFADRESDPDWRGCNVTMPLKEIAAAVLHGEAGRQLGAVNCVVDSSFGLLGLNTDVSGVGEALGPASLKGKRAVVIGAGGAARAAIEAAGSVRGATIDVLARDPGKAVSLRHLAERVSILPLEQAPAAITGASAIINATPLGMAGSPPMPAFVLGALSDAAEDAVAVDMVYRPLVTPFLAAAQAANLGIGDGLTALIGQARLPFELFFGKKPLGDDAALRALLIEQLAEG